MVLLVLMMVLKGMQENISYEDDEISKSNTEHEHNYHNSDSIEHQ